jgi:thiamine-phosphate pyrophosphorylase
LSLIALLCAYLSCVQLIVITPETTANNETDIVNALFAYGLQKLHLRKPAATDDELRAYINLINPQYHNRIVLHQHFILVVEFLLGGIHLSSHLRNDELIKNGLKTLNHGTLSASFHTWDEVRREGGGYHYVFISPVFDSISKPAYKAAVPMEDVVSVKQSLSPCPAIIALGGVEASNIATLKQHCFDGGALLGAVWQAEDPIAALPLNPL